MLVPSMPWFAPDTPLFGYDVERARELLGRAEAATLLTRRSASDFDLLNLGWGEAYDVAQLLAGYVLESGFNNRVGFQDPAAEAMLRTAAPRAPPPLAERRLASRGALRSVRTRRHLRAR